MNDENDWPAIEYDDGYPVDEEFKDWGDVSFPSLDMKKAGSWLTRELLRAASEMPCSCAVDRVETTRGKTAVRVSFSTLGWSGAEAIIGLVKRRPDLLYHLVSWRRGGHYVFEVITD